MIKYSVNSTTVIGRGIAEYEDYLGIDVDSLKGRVLDIGAGIANFQEQCNERGIDVTAIDPLYRPTNAHEFFKKYLSNPENRKNKIVAINEVMPFREGVFDIVLSEYSSIFYLGRSYPSIELRERMAEQMLEEIIRVLKPRGEARIAEIRGNRDSKDRKFYEPVLEGISKNLRLKFSWKFFVDSSPNYLLLRKH
jgi:SAM-dependent methyltransferase